MAKATRRGTRKSKPRTTRTPKSTAPPSTLEGEHIRVNLFHLIYEKTGSVKDAIAGAKAAYMFIKEPTIHMELSDGYVGRMDIASGKPELLEKRKLAHSSEKRDSKTEPAISEPFQGPVPDYPAEAVIAPHPKKHFDTDHITL